MNRVVLITGASSGIGLAIATHLSKKGYTVYGSSRSIPENKFFESIKFDVTDEDAIIKAVKYIKEKSGHIDVLINNAGVGSAGAFEKTPMVDIKRSFEVNCFGVIRVSQEVIPLMREQNFGRIINISTLGSTIGLPYRAFYSASKGAMDLVTESMRLELERFGIQACTIHPGDVKTNIAHHRIVSADNHDETYGKVFRKAFKAMDASVEHGKEPEIFGPLVEKIIQSKNIRRNYYVGSFMERLGHKLKKFLPYYMYEWILKQYFKA